MQEEAECRMEGMSYENLTEWLANLEIVKADVKKIIPVRRNIPEGRSWVSAKGTKFVVKRSFPARFPRDRDPSFPKQLRRYALHRKL